MRRELGTFCLLVVLCVIVAILNPRFLAVANFQNMARLIGAYGVFSIGLGIVIITGGIDLSVGSVFALLGVLLSIMLTEWGWASPLAVCAVIAIGMGLGWLHGLLITRLRLQPFIVTLCGLLLYRGLARFIANDETKGFGNAAGFEGLRNLATGGLLGIPMPFVLLLVVGGLMWLALHRSIYGRYLFAVGRNEEAARYSGVDVRRTVASAYVLSGALAGIAGIVFAFYTNSDLALIAREFLRALWHCGGGSRRLQLARWRGLDSGYCHWNGSLANPPESGQSPGSSIVTELCSHGCRDSGWCRRRSGADPPGYESRG